ncbi:hypothetical protein H0W91_02840 [Patescibacteria group bacterium]|nr:hypothetical protein [Patescibacteria group bacterium]
MGVGHSEGCINLLLAVEKNPEIFSNIILVAPAGLTGPDGFFYIIGRFLKSIKESDEKNLYYNEKSQRVITTIKETSKYLVKNPTKSFGEVYEISQSDTVELLKKIHDMGVGISIIHGTEDGVFSMEKMQNIVSAGIVDGFYSVSGDHNEIFVSPDKYAKLTIKAGEDLEKRKKDEYKKV